MTLPQSITVPLTIQSQNSNIPYPKPKDGEIIRQKHHISIMKYRLRIVIKHPGLGHRKERGFLMWIRGYHRQINILLIVWVASRWMLIPLALPRDDKYIIDNSRNAKIQISWRAPMLQVQARTTLTLSMLTPFEAANIQSESALNKAISPTHPQSLDPVTTR